MGTNNIWIRVIGAVSAAALATLLAGCTIRPDPRGNVQGPGPLDSVVVSTPVGV
jgi:hypothetical protein